MTSSVRHWTSLNCGKDPLPPICLNSSFWKGTPVIGQQRCPSGASALLIGSCYGGAVQLSRHQRGSSEYCPSTAVRWGCPAHRSYTLFWSSWAAVERERLRLFLSYRIDLHFIHLANAFADHNMSQYTLIKNISLRALVTHIEEGFLLYVFGRSHGGRAWNDRLHLRQLNHPLTLPVLPGLIVSQLERERSLSSPPQ